MARFDPEVYALRPWYHDFEKLGLQTRFAQQPLDRLKYALSLLRRAAGQGVEKGERFSVRALLRPAPPSHLVNQRHKEEYILPFIQRALAELGGAPACLDLFCADGYYSCTIAHARPSALVTGVDLDEKEITRARAAARLLGLPGAQFRLADVWKFIRAAQPYDLVLCTGGLYHLTEPKRFLELVRPISRQFLIVQSAITLETEDPDYFVSPAPGWKHGSRFTYAGLRRWLEVIGWEIVAEARNELTGNPRLCDRGSGYFLCRVRGEAGMEK